MTCLFMIAERDDSESSEGCEGSGRYTSNILVSVDALWLWLFVIFTKLVGC